MTVEDGRARAERQLNAPPIIAGTRLLLLIFKFSSIGRSPTLGGEIITLMQAAEPGMDIAFRGNVTQVTRGNGVNGGTTSTDAAYNDVGNVVATMDGNGATTTYSFTDNYYGPQPSQPTSAFATKITRPTTSGVQHVQTSQNYLNSGLPAAACGENFPAAGTCAAELTGINSDYVWLSYDGMNRTTGAYFGDGGSTVLSYVDTALVTTITQTRSMSSSQSIVDASMFDGLGRQSQRELTIGPGVRDVVDTAYDTLGRVLSVSSPYRSPVAPGDPPVGITSYRYDALGRKTIQNQSDGTSALYWCYSGVATSGQPNCTANVGGVTSAAWVDSTDETGIHTQHISDGLGRLIAVVEPDPKSGNLALQTQYSYDALGNLLCVDQWGATAGGGPCANASITDVQRSFAYDSLSRLMSSSNPETGSLNYTYDANSNVHSKTDARSITTTYAYDALNRLLSKLHTDVSLASCYSYDTATNGVSRLAARWTQGTACPSNGSNSPLNPQTIISRLAYDSMGRLKGESTTAPNGSSMVGATYDLAGNEISLTYPDGRTIQNSFDAAGRINAVTYQTWNSNVVNQTYFSETNGYDPAGHLLNANFGNGVLIAAGYDNRERIAGLAYGPSSTPLWSKQYAWTPNGNMQSQTDQITGVQRLFGYDNLNRLTSAQDVISSLTGTEVFNTGAAGSVGGATTLTPGATGVAPNFTNPDDSNLLGDIAAVPNSNWTGSGSNETITPSATIIAPDGTKSAVVATATGGTGYTDVVGSVTLAEDLTGETVNGSVWLQVPSGTQAQTMYILAISSTNAMSTLSAKPITVSTAWQQFNLSGVVPTSTTSLELVVGPGSVTTPANQQFYLWNPMLYDTGVLGKIQTNFLPYSQRFTASTWESSPANSLAVTDSAAMAPDGTNTASSIQFPAANKVLVGQILNPAPVAGLPVVGSVWLRAANGPISISFRLYEVGGTNSTAATETVTSTWQRFQFAMTPVSTLSSLNLLISPAGTVPTGGETIQAWGAQVELAASASQPIAGPYVGTAGYPGFISSSLTNLLPYSQQPAGSSWNFGTVTLSPQGVVAPDGSPTAAQVTGTSVDSFFSDVVPNPELYDGQIVTASVYLKLPSGTSGPQTVNLYPYSINAAGASYFTPLTATLTPNWQRFSVTGTVQSAISALGFQIGGAHSFGTGQAFDIWGAQMELAAKAGPYVATNALPIISGASMTNMIAGAQISSNTSWLCFTSNFIQNGDIAPDGTMTALIVQSTATSSSTFPTSAYAFIPNSSLYDGQTVTASIYLRSLSPGIAPFNISLLEAGNNPADGTVSSTTVHLTPQWKRFSVTGTLDNGLLYAALSYGPIIGGTFEMWGAQMELGSRPGAEIITPGEGASGTVATGQTPVTNGMNESYAYDSFGNILNNNSFSASYTVKNQIFGDLYDAAGNLLSDGINSYTWDAEGRMTSAAGTTYIYDADGNRVEKQGVGVTDTIYFGGHPIARLSAGQWTDLIYGPTGLLAEVPGTQTGLPVYRMTDQIGNVVGNLTSTGVFTRACSHYGQSVLMSVNGDHGSAV